MYEELAGYERILSTHIAGRLSGTIESARTAAQLLGGERVRTIDSGSASAAIALLGLAVQRRLEEGTTDEEVDRLVERYRRDAGLLFTLETFEYLVRGGRVVAAGPVFGEVGRAVAEALLAEPRDVLTLVTGEGAPSLDGLLDELAERHPELEIEVHEGGQPHYPLLLSAE